MTSTLHCLSCILPESGSSILRECHCRRVTGLEDARAPHNMMASPTKAAMRSLTGPCGSPLLITSATASAFTYSCNTSSSVVDVAHKTEWRGPSASVSRGANDSIRAW